MFDINGFLTSPQFFAQIASIIVAVLSALFEEFIGNFFASGI